MFFNLFIFFIILFFVIFFLKNQLTAHRFVQLIINFIMSHGIILLAYFRNKFNREVINNILSFRFLLKDFLFLLHLLKHIPFKGILLKNML